MAAISGAFGYWRETGRFVVFEAPTVILATGGIGKSFKVTSNSWEYTGDGHALALRAGASLINMEFVQFHPTGMVWPPSVKGLLVTESVRGDGGVLKNSEGKRFMFDYIPEFFKAETADTEEEADRWYDDKKNNRRPPELLPRDEVARAINSEIKAGRGSPHGGVFLDIASRRYAGVHPQAAAVDVPPVQGAGRRRHHRRADGDRADLPLRDGRRRGRRRHRGERGHRACTPSASARAACTAPTGSAATRSPTCSCSAGGPARPRRRTPPRLGRRRGRRSTRTTSRRRGTARSAPFEVEGGENPYTIQQDLQESMNDLVGIIRTGDELEQSLTEIEAFKERADGDDRRGPPAVQPRLAPRARPAQHAARLRVHREGRARPRGVARRPHPRRLPAARPRVWGTKNLVVTLNDAGDRRRPRPRSRCRSCPTSSRSSSTEE